MTNAGDKPRIRDASSWWIDHPDETVTLVVLRRVGQAQAEGGYLKLEFHAESEAAALALFDDYCAEAYERSRRHHERRQKWGPLELAS